METTNNQLYHHGVKGMRWGVRRYQNKDGSLTPLGAKRMDRLEGRKKAEELKGKRADRKMELKKAKSNIKQDTLDRKALRSKAKQDAKQDLLDRKVLRDKMKQDTADNAKDRKAARKSKASDDVYELPDDGTTYERRVDNGKKILTGVLAVAGVAAVSYGLYKASHAEGDNIVKTALEKIKSIGKKKKDADAGKQENDSKENTNSKIVDEILNDIKNTEAGIKANKKQEKQEAKASAKRTKDMAKQLKKDQDATDTLLRNIDKFKAEKMRRQLAEDQATTNKLLGRNELPSSKDMAKWIKEGKADALKKVKLPKRK